MGRQEDAVRRPTFITVHGGERARAARAKMCVMDIIKYVALSDSFARRDDDLHKKNESVIRVSVSLVSSNSRKKARDDLKLFLAI